VSDVGLIDGRDVLVEVSRDAHAGNSGPPAVSARSQPGTRGVPVHDHGLYPQASSVFFAPCPLTVPISWNMVGIMHRQEKTRAKSSDL
jgi:hypothetical protein